MVMVLAMMGVLVLDLWSTFFVQLVDASVFFV